MTSRFDQTTSRPSRRTISVKVLSIEHLGSSISYGEAKHVTSTLLFLSFLLCLTALITGCGSAASANSTAVATVTSTPQAPLSIASSTLTEADTAAPYIATLSATGGVKPYRRSIATRALPSGIQLGASSGTITGMTALSGSYPFTAKVTDSNGQGATLVLAPAVSPTLAIASSGCTPPFYTGPPTYPCGGNSTTNPGQISAIFTSRSPIGTVTTSNSAIGPCAANCMQWDSGTSFDTSWQTGVGAGNGGNILIGGGVGRVDTSGTSVTWVSGSLFRTSWTGTVTIAGVGYTISSCVSTNSCTLTTSAGSQSSVGYSVRGTPYGVATWNSSTVATLMEPPGTQAGVNYLDQTACVGGSATFLGNGCQNSVSEDTTIPGHVAGTNLITRIADQSTMYFGHSTGNFTRSEGDNDRDISANEKYLAFEVTGEEIQIAELTTAPGYVRVVNAGCAMPGIAPSAFGFTWNTDNEFYYITGSTLYSNTLSGTGCALAFGTPMVMAYLMGPGVCPGVTPFTAGSSSVLGISADDSTVFAALGPGGQGTADWVFAWSKTKGCATANFNTGQAWGYLAPGMCSTSACSEAIPPLGTFATGATNCWGSHGSSGDGIHDMVVTGDGLYAFITPQNGNWTQAGCANLSSGPMGYAVWQVGTLGNQWCSNNPGVNCGAHPAAGVSHFLTPNSHTGFNIRLDSDVQFDKSFLAPPPIEDEHLSWPHNDNGIFNDSLPWVGASDLALLSHASGCTGSGAYDSAVYCPTYLQNQIFAAFPHSVYPGEALIFSHTDECGYLPLSTYAQCADQIPENIGVAGAIGIVSPKGDFFCWGSSMLHNLGYDYLAAPQSSPFCLYLGVPQ